MVILKMKLHLSAFRKYAECLNFLHALCKYEHESTGRLKSGARTSSLPAYSNHHKRSQPPCRKFVSTVRPIGIQNIVSMPKKPHKTYFLVLLSKLDSFIKGTHSAPYLCLPETPCKLTKSEKGLKYQCIYRVHHRIFPVPLNLENLSVYSSQRHRLGLKRNFKVLPSNCVH